MAWRKKHPHKDETLQEPKKKKIDKKKNALLREILSQTLSKY